MNFEQARWNMIEQQIRTWEVLDQRVLDLLASVPREDFVPFRYRSLAFSDTNIPLGFGEVMMAPKVDLRSAGASSSWSGKRRSWRPCSSRGVGAWELAREGLFETDLPPLRGVPAPKRFVF